MTEIKDIGLLRRAASETQELLADFDCQSCGACCAVSHEWPRFTLETDAEIALIPSEFVNDAASGMRCAGDRCTALLGAVGQATSCAVYDIRPDVCRACQPGDEACQIARRYFGLDAEF